MNNKIKKILSINIIVMFFYFICPLLSIIFFTLGSSLFTTFISVKLAQQGVSQLEISYVQSAYYAGMLIGAILLEPQIRRLGHVRSYAVFSTVATFTILFQGFLNTLLFWIAMRFIFGMCISGIYIVVESWLLSESTLTTRGSALSLYMTILYITQSISHEFLHFTNFTTLWPFIISSLFCFFSAFPLFITSLPSPKIDKAKVKNIVTVFNISPFGFMGCLFSGFILSVIFIFVPNFAYYYHFSIPGLMQTTIMGGCLLQWPIGRMSDLYERRTILFFTSITTTISAFTILLFPSETFFVYAFSFILGGSSFTLYTLSIATVCDNLNPTEMTNINAILLFVYGVGSVLGPVMASLLMDISIRSLYGYITLVAGILTFIGNINMNYSVTKLYYLIFQKIKKDTTLRVKKDL